MTELVILGSGTPNPDRGRAGAAVAIVADDGRWVMVDAGRAATQRAIDAGLQLSDLNAVFITHHHSDHLSDLATLAIARWVHGAADALIVVAPAGPAARFAERCLDPFDDDCFHGQTSPGLPPRPSIEVLDFQPSRALAGVWADQRWHVETVLVDHHPVAPAVGYRVGVDGRVVAVSGDTAVCDGIRGLARDAHVLVHEAVLVASASPAMLAWNAGAISVGQLAAESAVGVLVLTHMLPAPTTAQHEQHYVDEARAGGWSGPIHVAQDLLRIHVRDG